MVDGRGASGVNFWCRDRLEHETDVNKPISTATQIVSYLQVLRDHATFTGSAGGFMNAVVGISAVDRQYYILEQTK